MKNKKRFHFPILLKVIFLGIITSFVASTVAVIVNYNNMIKKATDDLNSSANEALEYSNNFFEEETVAFGKNIQAFLYIKNHVLTGYNNTSSGIHDAQMSKYQSFLEYEEVFMRGLPYFYADGMFMTQDYLDFYNQYVVINQILLNASFYSEQSTYFAIKDPDNENRFVFLCDSRISTYKKKNRFYHCPGSHYDLQKGDKIIDIGHEFVKEYRLSKFSTRFIEINADYGEEGKEMIGYMFVEYDTSKAFIPYKNILRNEIIILSLTSIAIIAIYAVLSYFLFVRNINRLNKGALDISSRLKSDKQFEAVELKVKSHDEMHSLNESFMTLQNQIVNYVEIIKEDAKEKEKINAELEIASKIQLEALPNSSFDDEQVSIRAFMKPAKEVGGDFYDYFYINDNELAVVISDVSGKGVPAALFMMKSKELIKSQLLSGACLSDAVKDANEILNQNNIESLFVTSFIGVIDLEKEEMRYVNAGHEKPYIISNNKVTKLDCNSNFVLGGVTDIEYKEEKCKFHKGDIIFMFTDGLNESINSSNEEFSYMRIEECLNRSLGGDLENYISEMKKELAQFVGRKEAFDDITMVTARFNSNDLKLSFDKKDPKIIEEAVDRFSTSFAFIDDERRSKVGIILDELLNNLISYEERDDLHIDVEFTYSKGDIIIQITSNGSDYDPFKNNEEKYLTEYSESTIEGGFGVTLVKELSKEAKYSYKNSLSIITIKL